MKATLDDVALVAAVASGSSDALADLFSRHSDAVARYAWAFAPDEGAVQDLVQETFITLWSKSADIRLVGTSALPWLLVTCRNHGRNHRKKLARRAEVSLLEADGMEAAPAPELRWVMDIISALPETDRRVCQLCLVDGLSYKAAASELGVSVAWVGKRLQRARVRLRKEVMAHD